MFENEQEIKRKLSYLIKTVTNAQKLDANKINYTGLSIQIPQSIIDASNEEI